LGSFIAFGRVLKHLLVFHRGRGVNPGGWGSQLPQILSRKCWGSQEGSWWGREISLHLIMYRKSIRKWWLWREI